MSGQIHGLALLCNDLRIAINSRRYYVAKVAAFGFATCSQSHKDLVLMPDIKSWNAPEHHPCSFTTIQAKQMDTFSFSVLYFWLIFKAGSSVDLPLPLNTVLELSQFASFEQAQPEKNLLQFWRRDHKLVEWVCWLVREDRRFDNGTKLNNYLSSWLYVLVLRVVLLLNVRSYLTVCDFAKFK